MSASIQRAYARVAYYEALIEDARTRGESTEALEEKLFAAAILAELYEP